MTPNPLETLATRAMKAHREGRFLEAESICREALLIDASYFRSLIHLSVLVRNRGEFGQASDLACRAIEAEPEVADGYIQLGLAALGSGNAAEAAKALSRAIALSPRMAPIHYHLGMALENLGRTEDAKRAFLEASRLDPTDVRARLSLGSLQLAEQDTRGARTQAEAALRHNANSGAAHLLLAKISVAEGKGADAESHILASLALDPHSSFGHTMHGFRLLQKGEFAEAERAFERSITLDEAQGVAYFGITQARKLGEEDRALIARMQGVLIGTPLTLEQCSYLHFAIAKGLDNLGDYESAMGHFDEAHRTAGQFRFGASGFDRLAYEADIEAIRELYDGPRFGGPRAGIETDLPIFIVGMMRSGTTLTEQILSSHPAVGAAGENEFWARRGHEAEDLVRQKFDQAHATGLARQYCRELRNIAPGTKRITDKLPGNYLRLGEIHLALPNAKIIHCRRSPVDTALSIYMTPNPAAPAYSHSKEGIVFAYRQYESLMEHWRNVLPADRLYEVQYEELVRDPESVIRGMLDFLELEWDPACLSHHTNAKDVRTPSLWQVRQPMYSSSVQRWRRYEPWLGALRELLAPSDRVDLDDGRR